MGNEDKTKIQLMIELGELHQQMAELEKLRLECKLAEEALKKYAEEMCNKNEKLLVEISDRKKTEKLLKASEEKYSTLVEKGDDAIIVVQDGLIKYANLKMAEFTGYNKEELVGIPLLEHIPSEYKQMVWDRYEKKLNNDNSVPRKYELELLSRYDVKIPVEMNASPIDHEGKPAVMAIIRDTTERKRAEKSLKKQAHGLSKANEELKSLARMKDEFLSNVGHELKTPLVSIIGYNELMSDEVLGPLTQQQKKAMDAVMRNSEKLRRLIDSLLYLSIAKAGKIKYAFRPVHVDEIIERAIIQMVPQVKKEGLKIESDLPDDLTPIDGDRDYLVQVLTNLIDNAIKFTPSGG